MLALARRQLGDDAALHVVDVRDPLPFADGAFDDVVASLVLHYLEDWGPTLAEMRRVLRPGGRLIASVNHPFVEHLSQNPRPNYFATTSYTDAWTFADSPSDDLLAQVVAGDDRCLHQRRLPSFRHQRASARPGHP